MPGARQACARFLPVFVLTAASQLTVIHFDTSRSRRVDKAPASRTYSNLPVNFIENAGQTDARVRFYAHGADFAFFLTAQEAVFQFAPRSSNRATLLTPVADRSQTQGSSPAFAIRRWQSERDRNRRGACGRGGQLPAWRRLLALAAGLVAVPAESSTAISGPGST